MESDDSRITSQPHEDVEQQIRLEEATRPRIETEAKQAKQEARDASIADIKKRAKTPLKVKLIALAVVVVVAVVLVGVVAPLVFNRSETKYFATSDLKEAVAIESLSTIEYKYHGVAEHHSQLLMFENIDYRVKYEAHVRASCDMTKIEFEIDEANKKVVAYLPEAEIDTPVLDETKFGYLPESATALMKDVLVLCKEDATNDVNRHQMQKEADSSLKDIIKALTTPFLGDNWTLDFKTLAECPVNIEGGESGEE